MSTVVYLPQDTRWSDIGSALGLMLGHYTEERRQQQKMQAFGDFLQDYMDYAYGPAPGATQTVGGSGQGGAGAAAPQVPGMGAPMVYGDSSGRLDTLPLPGSSSSTDRSRPPMDFGEAMRTFSGLIEPAELADWIVGLESARQERVALERYQDALDQGMDPYDAASQFLPPRLWERLGPMALENRARMEQMQMQYEMGLQQDAIQHGYRMEEISASQGGDIDYDKIRMTGPQGQEVDVSYPRGTNPDDFLAVQQWQQRGYQYGAMPDASAGGTVEHVFTNDAGVQRKLELPASVADPRSTPGGAALERAGFSWGSRESAERAPTQYQDLLAANEQIYAGEVQSGQATHSGMVKYTQFESDGTIAESAYRTYAVENPADMDKATSLRVQLFQEEMGKSVRAGKDLPTAEREAAAAAEAKFLQGGFIPATYYNPADKMAELRGMANYLEQNNFEEEDATQILLNIARRRATASNPGGGLTFPNEVPTSPEEVAVIVNEVYHGSRAPTPSGGRSWWDRFTE